MKTKLLILFALIMSAVSGQNFTPIWEGNGFGHMNIYIVNAELDKQALQPGDQIGIFAGDDCVGFTTIENTYPHSAYLKADIITSMNDGTGNGFNETDSIIFKIWDVSENKLVDFINATYFNDIDFWTTDGKFSQHGSAFVSLEGKNIVKKKVAFSSGLNELQISLDLLSNSLEDFFKPLADAGLLVKVQNTKGQAYEKVNNSTWINAIGSINQDETYFVIVNQNCELEITGLVK